MTQPSRFLLISPPLVAHVNPLASIATELVARGHTVAFTSYPGVEHIFPATVSWYPLAPDEVSTRALTLNATEEVRSTAAAFKLHWEDIDIPLCRAMLPQIGTVIEEFQPDMVLIDQTALAGALAARQRGLLWATSVPSADVLVDYSPTDIHPGFTWLKGILDDLQLSLGLEPTSRPANSPHLVLAHTTRDFADYGKPFPDHYKFVGVCIKYRERPESFPWEQLASERKKIYVSLGSMLGTRGTRFILTLVEALRDEPVQVIVSDPAQAIEDVPENFLVRPWLPQIDLLARVDLLVTHGGSSVNEALHFGVPLVVAPFHLDNFVFASKVVEKGAGLRLRFTRSGVTEVKETIHSALSDPSFKEAAAALGRSFAAAGGTDAAATELEKLLAV